MTGIRECYLGERGTGVSLSFSRLGIGRVAVDLTPRCDSFQVQRGGLTSNRFPWSSMYRLFDPDVLHVSPRGIPPSLLRMPNG